MWDSRWAEVPCHVRVPRALGPNQFKVANVAPLSFVTYNQIVLTGLSAARLRNKGRRAGGRPARSLEWRFARTSVCVDSKPMGV